MNRSIKNYHQPRTSPFALHDLIETCCAHGKSQCNIISLTMQPSEIHSTNFGCSNCNAIGVWGFVLGEGLELRFYPCPATRNTTKWSKGPLLLVHRVPNTEFSCPRINCSRPCVTRPLDVSPWSEARSVTSLRLHGTRFWPSTRTCLSIRVLVPLSIQTVKSKDDSRHLQTVRSLSYLLLLARFDGWRWRRGIDSRSELVGSPYARSQ